MTSTIVSAVYELPRLIWIDYEVLGGCFETRIGPLRATVMTPSLNADTHRIDPPALAGVPDAAFAPLIGELPTKIDAYHRSASVLNPTWCTEYAADHPPRSTALRVVGIELVEDDTRPLDDLTTFTRPPDRIHDVAGRCMEAWFMRLAEWVSVLTGQDLDHRHQIYDAEPIGSGFRSWGSGVWLPTSTSYRIPKVKPIGRDQLGCVLGQIGSGQRPPLEWQLMLAGASALDRGHARRAVSDFATAVEVCLTRLVRKSTSTENRPGNNSTLRTWSNWLVKHEPSYKLDADFEAFVTLRNNIVHRAQEPTYDEAREAYECAARIVAAYGHARDGSDGS